MNHLGTALAIGHHLLVFGLISILFGEYTILKFPVDQSKALFLIKLNYWYIGVLLGALAIGLGRVFYGDKPSIYYLSNLIFWIKITAVLVLLIYGIRLSGVFQNLYQSTCKIKDFQFDQLLPNAYRMVFVQMHLFPIPIIAAVLLAKGY